MTEHDYCYQCKYMTLYKSHEWRGYCRFKKIQRNCQTPACISFKPRIPCPLCIERPVNPKDGLGICRSCRGEIEVNKRTIYKVKAK